MKLNCDAGESFGAWKMGMDEAILPYVDMANFACGFHGGDPLTMENSIKLAKKYNILIGAHPSYPDLVGFGRRSMVCSHEEIKAYVLYQIGALDAFCKANETKLFYVKPHGALYNDMAKDLGIFEALVQAVSTFDVSLKVMILSKVDNHAQEKIARKYGIKLLYEVFADRAYDDAGFLVPRSQKNSVLHDAQSVIDRYKLLKNEGLLESINGKKIQLKADSLCLHGDNEAALLIVKTLRKIM